MPKEQLTHEPYAVKVYANDDGQAECGTCHVGMEPAEVYWLLRAPNSSHWYTFCWDCTKYFMTMLSDEVEGKLFVVNL